jgi:hypothetical protein
MMQIHDSMSPNVSPQTICRYKECVKTAFGDTLISYDGLDRWRRPGSGSRLAELCILRPGECGESWGTEAPSGRGKATPCPLYESAKYSQVTSDKIPFPHHFRVIRATSLILAPANQKAQSQYQP